MFTREGEYQAMNKETVRSVGSFKMPNGIEIKPYTDGENLYIPQYFFSDFYYLKIPKEVIMDLLNGKQR